MSTTVFYEDVIFDFIFHNIIFGHFYRLSYIVALVILYVSDDAISVFELNIGIIRKTATTVSFNFFI
jgi:hypothetical protein